MSQITIKTAQQTGIIAAKNNYIVNDYKGTVGLRHNTYEAVNNTLLPLNALNNAQVHFDLPTGDMAINIPESYLEFTVKFNYHFTKYGVARLINGIWY